MSNKNIYRPGLSCSWHHLLRRMRTLTIGIQAFGIRTHSLRFLKCPDRVIRCFAMLCVLMSLWQISYSQKATWIWYPGDFEIDLANKMQNRRMELGTFFPVFWKMDNHYVLVDFHKVFDVPDSEEVNIYAEGEYNVKLDGKAFEGSPKKITV